MRHQLDKIVQGTIGPHQRVYREQAAAAAASVLQETSINDTCTTVPQHVFGTTDPHKVFCTYYDADPKKDDS